MNRSRWWRAAMLIAATSVLGVAPASGQSPAPTEAPGGVMSVSDGPGFANAFAYGAATAPDGSVVMVGEHLGSDPTIPAKAAAWHSLDGGSTWTEVPLPQSKHALALNVAVSDIGWAAVGFVADGAGLVWTSTDGISWVRAKPLKGGQPQTVITTTDGFLAAGQSIVKGVARPVLWRSSDLVKWTRAKLPGKGLVTQLAQGPSGVILALVATVSSNGLSYRYLRSVDGSTWDLVDFPATRSGTDILSAAELGTSGDLFIQLVDGGPAAGPFAGSVWTSPDGLAWREAWTASGPLFAVASGPVVNVFGQGLQGASPDGITWTETARPEILLTSGATALPDRRSLVVDNDTGTPPSIVVQLVPATVGAAPDASTAPRPSAPTPSAPAGSAPPGGSSAP